MLIDAQKGPEDDHQRPWPDDIVMSLILWRESADALVNWDRKPAAEITVGHRTEAAAHQSQPDNAKRAGTSRRARMMKSGLAFQLDIQRGSRIF